MTTESENSKYLSIGKVAKMVGVETHTIRFWCNQFADTVPCVRGKGDRRYYTKESVEKLQQIKDMMHDDGMRIKGIKKALTNKQKHRATNSEIDRDAMPLHTKELLRNILQELRFIKQDLDANPLESQLQ